MEWQALALLRWRSTHTDKHLGIYQGFSIVLSTTMYLAVVP